MQYRLIKKYLAVNKNTALKFIANRVLQKSLGMLTYLLLSSPACAELLHRWSFNDPSGPAVSGRIFPDGNQGLSAVVRGKGATLDGNFLVLPGTTNGNQNATNISAYLDLPNGIISSKNNLTLECWLKPSSSSFRQRIFDFGNAKGSYLTGDVNGETIDGSNSPGILYGEDTLSLTLNQKSTLGIFSCAARLNNGATYYTETNLSSSTSSGINYHFVLTVQEGVGIYGPSGCVVKWYRDGVMRGSLDLAFKLSEMTDVNNWIGRSQWSSEMIANYSLDEFRIYDHAMTSAQVVTSRDAGPNALFPAPLVSNDSGTLHTGQKISINVLKNDLGAINPSTVEIVSPPSVGSVSVNEKGIILYSHPGGADEPVSFSYRVAGIGGYSQPATVEIAVTNQLRIANSSINVPQTPPATAYSLVPAFPGVVFNKALCFASPPLDMKRLFVCQIGGLVKVIPDVTSPNPTSTVVLNLPAAINTPPRAPAESINEGLFGENGLLGLAFHPDFSSNGYFYIAYTVLKSGSPNCFQRLSRFTISPEQKNLPNPVADPTSELILIEQEDRDHNHNGGDLHFGTDGYLYWAVGDEGDGFDHRVNSQRIDKDFFSSMIRIDVDKKIGNLEPNHHASVPRDMGIARYSIPADNPYVGATSFNGLPVTPELVRTEFYATGIRAPWRFSIDASSGEIWLGDVGQHAYEEVNLITKGGNYGWVYREGKHNTNFTTPAPPPKPSGFTSIDPIYEYQRIGTAGNSNFKGNAVIGGLVYRGSNLPSLHGAYIFGDYTSGYIWSLRREGDVPGGAVTVERIAGLSYLTNFGTDPSNGDILVSDYYDGRIMRLVSVTETTTFPSTLSETGLFADLTDLSPSPGLLPYEPNISFWSDHAIKRRWFAIPDESSRMTWSRDGAWTFPAGQIWVKHFDLETVNGNPATKKRIETRVLVKTDTSSYGVSYRWNEVGTEATLVEDGGQDLNINVSYNGVTSEQTWRIPSRSQCASCHTTVAGHALSFNTRQLNLSNSIQSFTGNQLDALSLAGYLTNTIDTPATLPRHKPINDTSQPLEARVRSYLDVNCAYCHQAGGPGSAWDGRHHLTLEQTGIIFGQVSGSLHPQDKLVIPGESSHSVILSRTAATNGYTRMPPLGSNVTDAVGIALLTEWIDNELPTRPLYDTWRSGFFSAPDPDGDRTADPDRDGIDNYREYLLGSSPLTGAGAWQAQIQTGETRKLRFLKKSHRIYQIQASETLSNWTDWNPLTMPSGYSVQDEWVELPITPTPSGNQFFRFTVSEP